MMQAVERIKDVKNNKNANNTGTTVKTNGGIQPREAGVSRHRQ